MPDDKKYSQVEMDNKLFEQEFTNLKDYIKDQFEDLKNTIKSLQNGMEANTREIRRVEQERVTLSIRTTENSKQVTLIEKKVTDFDSRLNEIEKRHIEAAAIGKFMKALIATGGVGVGVLVNSLIQYISSGV